MRGGKSSDRAITRASVEKSAAIRPEDFWVRFWAKAREARGGCYVWGGPTDTKGRGVAQVGGRVLSARAVAWAYDGKRLEPGQGLTPTCKRARCIRPDHLEVAP